MFDRIIALCRPGFEKECAAELQHYCSETGYATYAKTETSSGLVQIISSTRQPLHALLETVQFDTLIFCRQWFTSGEVVSDLPEKNRIQPLLAITKRFGLHFNDIELAWPDTNEGKSISKFCKQFKPHLITALKKQKLLSQHSSQRLHVLFLDSRKIFVGYAKTDNSAAVAMGILRLKHANDAPSRSTLKLDEAIQVFIKKEQMRQFIKPGMKAIDLGAAPGGWSWQLTQRGMLVTAIDNGPMQNTLMQSGMVEHIKADAFNWMPDNTVDWLVCDMVERPLHVSRMICKWFTQNKCHYCIFNLKLPMKKRLQSVAECLKLIHDTLEDANIQYQMQAKQLYYDREEITVFLRRRHTSELTET